MQIGFKFGYFLFEFIEKFLSLTVPVVCISGRHVLQVDMQCPVGGAIETVFDTECSQCILLAWQQMVSNRLNKANKAFGLRSDSVS